VSIPLPINRGIIEGTLKRMKGQLLMKRVEHGLIGFILLCLSCGESLANGTAILQSAKVVREGQTSNQELLWYLTAREFRLAIKAEQHELTYVFNGRNLYACIRLLRGGEVKFDDQTEVGKALVKAIYDGICLIASNKVMASFFISPLNAASILDFSESLRLNFELEKFDLKNPAVAPQTVSAQTCRRAQMSYQFAYQSFSKNQVTQHEGQEGLCTATDLAWRPMFWRLFSRQLLQQGDVGLSLHVKLKDSPLRKMGLDLQGKARHAVRLGEKAKPTLSTIELETKKVEKTSIPAAHFRVPSGYVMLSDIASNLKDAPIKGKQAKQDAQEELPETLGRMLQIILKIGAPL